MHHKKHKVNPLRHTIQFKTAQVLHITLETERLSIQSVTDEDEKNCIELLADPIVMEKLGTGIPFNEKETKERLKIWLERWQNHDPFSVYTIIDKSSHEFLGIIAISHSAPGESEVSYVLHQRSWGKRYGSEAADAVFQSLIPRLMLRGYALDNAALRKCIATARLDNPASQKILCGVGFKETKTVHKFGAWRQSYVVYAKQLRNEYLHFFDRRAEKKASKAYLRLVEAGAEFTAEEMAASSFGQMTLRHGNSF